MTTPTLAPEAIADRPPTVYLTLEQAAERLHVCTKTLSSRIRRGEIPARKLGQRILIVEAELEAAVAALPAY